MSEHDGDRGIARRKVLAAAAGVGGLGVAGGVGSAAILRDEESFGGLFGSGSLDLAVTWEGIEDGEAETDGGSLTAKLQPSDRDGSGLLKLALPGPANNPGHVWLRPTCPSEAGLADVLELTISYADAQGVAGEFVHDSDGEDIDGRTLRDLAEQPGTKLRFGDDGCLDGDASRYLLVEWEYTTSGAGFETADFDFEFFAGQCRNDDSPANPYDPQGCATPTPTPAETPTNEHAISNIGFCTDSAGPINPAVTSVNNADPNNPTSVDWETDVEVDFVTLFFGYNGGPRMTIYDYRDDDDRTSGTALRNDPDAAVQLYDPGGTTGGGGNGNGGGAGGAPSRPCEIADEQLDTDDSFSVSSTAKLEFVEENAEFEEVDDDD
ncbi:hypothetical protein [Haloglomus litoreum]|uniref:hypothetical protein n=1 Tax=Haloglomus litoreum TaxID=3034026 RepID=UPI0023E75681|nr:hypothetical protein [Haloglomus sp. DT116]